MSQVFCDVHKIHYTMTIGCPLCFRDRASRNLEDATPSDLEEAIVFAMLASSLNNFKDRSYAMIRDFLAQRFQVAMMANPNAEEVLLQLFKDITRRKE